MNKTGTTERALLINHKPEPIRRHPSQAPRRLRRSLYTASLSLVDCISSSHAIQTQRTEDWLGPV
uniref:Uncharacterized protein n=1 Tax=Mesocestoides corti TaxID=53468 RepID=A0A5K3FL59_MESCO